MLDNSFDYIAQELLKQKRTMDALQAENRDLRRQLGELRTGRGIFIEIAGRRFPLNGDTIVSQPIVTSNPTAQIVSQPIVTSNPTAQLELSALAITPPPLTPATTPALEVEILDTTEEEQITSELVAEVATAEVAPVQQQPEELTFLEEIMLDEFAAASTNHLATWSEPVKIQEPAKKQEPEVIDEDQKAALRRELMGSFLLE